MSEGKGRPAPGVCQGRSPLPSAVRVGRSRPVASGPRGHQLPCREVGRYFRHRFLEPGDALRPFGLRLTFVPAPWSAFRTQRHGLSTLRRAPRPEFAFWQHPDRAISLVHRTSHCKYDIFRHMPTFGDSDQRPVETATRQPMVAQAACLGMPSGVNSGGLVWVDASIAKKWPTWIELICRVSQLLLLPHREHLRPDGLT